MNRDSTLSRIADGSERWDVIVIGGGATGLGAAVESASRGYRTLLVEKGDFAQGTSSRSTKLIHGGVRYLRQGRIGLVRDSLRERGLLLRNAPHLVRPRAFVIPIYEWWEAPFYVAGLKLYDLLAGSRAIAPSRHLSRAETIDRLPGLETTGLRGGVLYHDAQFDDARLAIALAQTFADLGGAPINYMRATGLLKRNDIVCGVSARDLESGNEYIIPGRVVINATGVFSDSIRRMDDERTSKVIQPSQGAHLVLDKSFLPGEAALMVPRTEDGRVLFAIPWHDRVLIGTTDTPVSEISMEPRPLESEIDYLLAHAGRYLTHDPERVDILSAFAGLRPLIRARGSLKTSRLPRDYVIEVSASGLVTITGGKWTTYRKMGEDVIDRAAEIAGLETRASVTRNLSLHEAPESCASELPDAPLRYSEDDILRAVRDEMARTVEDVLARRTRALFLDARASIDLAPAVACLLAADLGRDAAWQAEQVATYRKLASGYLPLRACGENGFHETLLT